MPPSRGSGADLSRLADHLILRHLRVSVPDHASDAAWWQHLQEGREDGGHMERKVRCVAIVGAGASAPLFGRGEDLADKLEKTLEDKFHADNNARKAELFRLERLYGLDADAFETRLAVLSRTPEVAEFVRHEISEHYSYRHPTILGYELLAHLLKHRFLDAIISFNFDELLDQSLDDELGIADYRRLVSDRDAVSVVRDPDSVDYLPMYIKLHGTATDPGSLRFTREAYYQLPTKLTSVVHDLFESDLCVIVNVGSAMTGFDLHRLLRIPKQLEVYDLSYVPLTPTVQNQITEERLMPLKDSLAAEDPRPEPSFAVPEEEGTDCNIWMTRLVREIEHRSGANAEADTLASAVTFRSVDRHEAVADVLNPDQLRSWIREPAKYHADYVRYLCRRTLLELTFSGAKARGLAQLSWLAVDRCGKYYELYRRMAKDAPERPRTWSELQDHAGLVESPPLPDVVQAIPELCTPETAVSDEEFRLRKFIPEDLARRVSRWLGELDPTVQERLADTLKKLQAGSEVEIQPTDDRVCSKAFNSPVTLPTVTSLRAFTLGLFQGAASSDEVYIVCETGEWLLADDEMARALLEHDHITMITAFEDKYKQLIEELGDKLTIVPIDPWRHNRHMTIMCRGGAPDRAIYFARRLRTPLITPVYLKDSGDARRVKRAFDLLYKEAGGDEAAAAARARALALPPPDGDAAERAIS